MTRLNSKCRPFIVTIVLIVIITFIESYSPTIEAQNSLWLHKPFVSTYRITSYVDHQEPFDKNDNPVIMYNGEPYSNCPDSSDQWTTQGPYCYDGHEGIDWTMGTDTKVLAAASGKIVFAGVDANSPDYGSIIRIGHGNGYETRYAHLDTIFVQTNDEVKASDQIALSGNTGNSGGPHLHFEVRHTHNNRVTDPFGWRGDDPDPLINYSGETATCLWANEWCNETVVEDGDINHDSTLIKFAQFGGGWQWSSQGNSWTMKYVANGEGSSSGYWMPFLPNPGPYQVLAFIPDIADKTAVSYTIHDQNGQYSHSVNQAAYTNQWVDLGRYTFGTGANNYVKLTNDVGPQNGKVVVFDTIKFRQFQTFLPIIFKSAP